MDKTPRKFLRTPNIGERFGHLTVVDNTARRYYGNKGYSRPACVCKCDCGTDKTFFTYSLLHGEAKSCGCKGGRVKVPRGTGSGETETRLYKIWLGVLARCINEDDHNYYIYGARGIGVCQEWAESYQPFKQWALANGYTDDLTIDRIDVNGDYEPNNCRWATVLEQQNNKRSNKFVTYNGKTQTISMWAREAGLNRDTLGRRLKAGWSVEKALTRPSQRAKAVS